MCFQKLHCYYYFLYLYLNNNTISNSCQMLPMHKYHSKVNFLSKIIIQISVTMWKYYLTEKKQEDIFARCNNAHASFPVWKMITYPREYRSKHSLSLHHDA